MEQCNNIILSSTIMNCPKCNHVNVNDAKYCTECGTPLYKLCDNCGKQNYWATKFCSECGSQFPAYDLRVEYYKRRLNFYDEIMIGESRSGKYVVVKERQKFKLLNISNLKQTISYEFEDIGRFAELNSFNFVIVKKDGLWGLINPMSGKIILDFKYEDYILVYFEGSYDTDGTVLIKEKGKWGKVDGDSGQIILPCIYDEIYENALYEYNYNNFDLLKYDGFWGVVADGKQIIPFDYIKLGYRVNNSFGYLYDFETNDDYNIPLSQYKNGKWGIINIYSGEILLKPEYDDIRSLGNNTCKVSKDEKWGVINDHNYEIVLACEYEQIEIFSKSGDYKVRQQGEWGVVNSHGVVLIECIFDEIIEWGLDNEYHVYKLQKDDKLGLYSNREIILPCEFDEIVHGKYQGKEFGFDWRVHYISKSYYKMRKGNKWGVCTNRSIVLACEYDEIETGERFHNYKIRKGYKFGVASCDGVILPCEYDEICFESFSENITMRKGDKWGKVVYHRISGDDIMPPERFDYECVYSKDEIKKLR